MPETTHSKAYLALAAVCFFWGTTYLAIRIGLESFSPAMLMSLRFLISGLLMLGGARWSGTSIPKDRELWMTGLNGLLLLGMGTGSLVFSEQWIPSGLAALFVTLSPFWMVGFEALAGGESLHAPTIGGMLVGFAGVAFLVAPGIADLSHQGLIVTGFLVQQVGCAGWAAGSIWQRKRATTTHPVIAGAVQQVAVGLVFLVPALLLPGQRPPVWDWKGISAILYLVTFGSIVGYSAYMYTLAHLPVAVVSIYTYVNPAVAVFLGWLIYREPFGAREAIAMLIIFAGVAIVKQFGHKPAK